MKREGGISDALGPLIVVPKNVRRSDVQTPSRLDADQVARPAVQSPRRPELPLKGTAKSKHPDFQKKTLYVRKSTMRDAMRRYEDEGGVEESDLVQMLLERYVGGEHGR